MRPVWAALTLSVLMLTACNVPVEQVPEAPPIPQVQVFNPAQGAPWQKALAKLPFELSAWTFTTNPSDTPLRISGAGLVTPEQVAGALVSAGIPYTPEQVTVLGPPTLPTNSETVPLRFEVLPVENAQAGQPVWIRVKVTNLSADPIRLEYGAISLWPILLDDSGQPVRWIRRDRWTLELRRVTVPAKGAGYLNEVLLLNRFNPNLPLSAGVYQPTMAISRMEMITSPSDRRKIEFLARGPKFTIKP